MTVFLVESFWMEIVNSVANSHSIQYDS